MSASFNHIAVRFCPPVPTWGSPLTFADQFIPKLLRSLNGALLYTSLPRVAGYSRVISAQNPIHQPGKIRQLAGLLGYHKTFARELRRKGVRLLFCPFHNEALAYSAGIRQVFIIHDLVPILYPRDFIFSRFLWATLYRRAVLNAHHIICVSHATKDAVLRHFKLPESRVSVVYNGFTAPAEFRARMPENRLLYVASAHNTHKNIRGLIDGFAQSALARSHQLVIVGVPNPRHTPGLKLRVSHLGLEQNIQFRSFLSQFEMETEYATAQMLVYPSLCEGFGLPLIEGMARGVPVCASSFSAIPEIGGPAALYFDPTKPADIAQSIERLASDSRLREELITRGKDNVKRFSWTKSAESVAEICASAA